MGASAKQIQIVFCHWGPSEGLSFLQSRKQNHQRVDNATPLTPFRDERVLVINYDGDFALHR
jgi:hypothetical protein